MKIAGWVLNRVRGSHHIMTKGSIALPVPVHGSREIGAGLLFAIRRQSGVKLNKCATMEICYPATLEPQVDGSFLVQFMDLPDTFMEGQTREEALFNASEVLSAMLAWRLDEAKDVPAPSLKVAGAHYIAPDAKTQAAMLLRLARGERSLADLARVLETSWPAAKRLEDPTHWPSLKTLDRAAAALGNRLVLVLQ